MPVYEILLSKAARKQLASLPVFIDNKIIEEISACRQTGLAFNIGLRVTSCPLCLRCKN